MDFCILLNINVVELLDECAIVGISSKNWHIDVNTIYCRTEKKNEFNPEDAKVDYQLYPLTK